MPVGLCHDIIPRLAFMTIIFNDDRLTFIEQYELEKTIEPKKGDGK
jgi:hypothetical protein